MNTMSDGQTEACSLARNLVDAIADCVVASAMELARRKGIRIDSIQPQIEGAVETQRFLGFQGELQDWYRQIQIRFPGRSSGILYNQNDK